MKPDLIGLVASCNIAFRYARRLHLVYSMDISLMWNYFPYGRQVHRFILYQNYMKFPLVLYPHPILRLGIALFAVAEGWLLLNIG